MEPSLDFENFYSNVLLPSMEGLKKQDNASESWGYKAIAAIIIAIIIGILIHIDILPTSLIGFVAVATIIFVMIAVFMYTEEKDRFTDNYKKLVIQKMVEHINPSFVYKPNKSVTAQEYVNSSLVRARYASFTGEDYIEGVYNGVSFHCSEVTTLTDREKNIFNGLFMVVKINDVYQCGTYAWTKGFEQLPASMMDQYYRLIPMAEVYDVNTGDAAFHHYYRVCTTYSGEALSILNNAVRAGMVKLIEYMNRPVGVSFVMGYCYIAIPFDEDMFDAGNYYADDKDILKRHFATIALIPAIINDLRLFDLQ